MRKGHNIITQIEHKNIPIWSNHVQRQRIWKDICLTFLQFTRRGQALMGESYVFKLGQIYRIRLIKWYNLVRIMSLMIGKWGTSRAG